MVCGNKECVKVYLTRGPSKIIFYKGCSLKWESLSFCRLGETGFLQGFFQLMAPGTLFKVLKSLELGQ
jgi:hypothetical protein